MICQTLGSVQTRPTITFAAAPRVNKPVARKVVCASMVEKIGQTAAAVAATVVLAAGSASALTYNELQGLTYLQVKGTGIANTCPTIE